MKSKLTRPRRFRASLIVYTFGGHKRDTQLNYNSVCTSSTPVIRGGKNESLPLSPSFLAMFLGRSSLTLPDMTERNFTDSRKKGDSPDEEPDDDEDEDEDKEERKRERERA